MDRNVWIAVALAAVLVGFGVVVGAGFTGSQAPPAVGPPDLLEADAPPPSHAPTAEGPLLGSDLGPQVLQRLGRLEAAVAELRKEQSKMARGMAPAAELLAFFERRLPGSRASVNTNRTATIATLRNVTSAQAQLQASARIDQDKDGTGEFGGFLEMSGAAEGRMARKLMPPVLSRAFSTLNEYGEATRSGYLYRFYLPGSGGEGIGEPPEGFSPTSGVDPDLSETTWCCYAWPVDAKANDARVYFMNQAGDVLSTQDTRYSGPGNGPLPDSAFLARKTITGPTAIGKTGQDGNVWKQVN